MAVEMIDDVDGISSWFEYISNKKSSSIFHTARWIDVIKNTYGYRFFVIVNKKNGLITTGFPFLEVDSVLTGKRWISLPFTDYYDPLTSEHDDLYMLLSHLSETVSDDMVPKVEVRCEVEHEAAYFTQKDVLHLLKLDSDYSMVERFFHKSHVRNMKTARRNDVHIEFGSDIASVEKFYRLHMMTRKRQGVPVQPWRFFKNLYRSIIDNDMGFILLAYHQKNCVAGAVFLYWNDILTYKFGASHPNYLSVRPNNLIFSEAIRWGCHHGLRVLDMGKTDCQNKGLRRFKSYWGAHEKPLKYTHFSKSLPKQNHSSVIEASLKLVIRNTPLFMTRCLGELFYKDFA